MLSVAKIKKSKIVINAKIGDGELILTDYKFL